MKQPAVIQQPVVRIPAECSASEIKAFVSLAGAGEEVEESDIERGTKRARYLLWIDDGEIAPCAVAALKNPIPKYRSDVFEKAGSLLRAADYSLEFGYAFTDERRRRRGHARTLLQKALELAALQGIYATVRSDNEGMRELLR
jgi:GNAT superfamily N-acetyltransferase